MDGYKNDLKKVLKTYSSYTSIDVQLSLIKEMKLIVLLFILYRYLVINLRCKRFKIKA